MRRKDREITDRGELLSVIAKCSVCRLAFFDREYPYIIPLNFGFVAEDDCLSFYFHCAKEGKKLDLLRQNNKVGFELDCSGSFHEGEKACYSTMEFESICGCGTLAPVGESKKAEALKILMRQYSDKREITFDERVLASVTVLKLTVIDISGKRLRHE